MKKDNVEISEQEWLQRLAAYCTAAERCAEDVRRKLHGSGLSAEAEERVIARLRAEKFIDEERYCRSFVHDKLRFNRWGRIKISAELHQRRLPSESVSAVLAAIDPDEYAGVLYAVLQAKRRSLRNKDTHDTWHKLLRFALSHGFEHAEAKDCLLRMGVSFYGDESGEIDTGDIADETTAD
jgi:regulatory protein